MNVKTNVFRDGFAWCHASWIDGEFDRSDLPDIDDSASEKEALEFARGLYSQASDVMVHRVADINTWSLKVDAGY